MWVDGSDLSDIALAQGPFLTVVLATEAAVENASQTNQTRWRAQRDQLATDGTAEAALAAIDPLIPDAHLDGNTVVAVANEQGLLHASHWPKLPFREMARWEALPVLAPLIDLRQSLPAHVIVVADRTGADVTAVHQEVGELHRSVDGDLHHARKVSAGGWSQRRYQDRAEVVWERNASEAAAVVARLADRVEAEIVLLAGDVRAVQLLQADLPQPLAAKVHVVDGSRAEDGSPGVDPEELDRALAAVTARDDDALLAKLAEERGQGDRAASGVAGTIAALAQAQVQVLLLHADPDDGRRAWFGADPTAISVGARDLRGLGVSDPQEGRLADVLLRAAIGTGAGIRIVPPGDHLPEDVAAILRWA